MYRCTGVQALGARPGCAVRAHAVGSVIACQLSPGLMASC